MNSRYLTWYISVWDLCQKIQQLKSILSCGLVLCNLQYNIHLPNSPDLTRNGTDQGPTLLLVYACTRIVYQVYGFKLSSVATLLPVFTFCVGLDAPSSSHRTLYPVMPSSISAGAFHVMLIELVEIEVAASEDGLPGKPKKKSICA